MKNINLLQELTQRQYQVVFIDISLFSLTIYNFGVLNILPYLRFNISFYYTLVHGTLNLMKGIFLKHVISQPAFICSKLTIKTLEQGVKYVQS